MLLDFGLKDFIDILLVSFFLFQLYKMVWKSRVRNIFIGVLLFIWLWFVVTNIFEMQLIGTIFNRLINMGGLILVVMFQEELREFFSKIGTQRIKWVKFFFYRRESVHIEKDFSLPIVLACMNMAKQKVGALIVIERNNSLQEIIQTGECLDAKISQRLLENLFFKNSPLHDGAVIISQQRIAAAGAILPISHKENIPKMLGLRHRAAMGLSEKTDALVIVVSEETGT